MIFFLSTLPTADGSEEAESEFLFEYFLLRNVRKHTKNITPKRTTTTPPIPPAIAANELAIQENHPTWTLTLVVQITIEKAEIFSCPPS